MKVSIITATYNSAKTISDALQSVKEQSYHNIEHIIIDGASSDDTLNIIKKNGSRVSLVVSEPDSGIYDALNKGISAATGDIIGFMHSDDVFASNKSVENMVDKYQNSDADAIYCDLNYVDKNNTEKVIRKWISGDFSLSKLHLGWMPPHPTFYMKRALYAEFGGFDLSYKIAADYDSMLRYLWKKRITITYFPEVLVKMRVGGASNRSLKNIIQKTKEDKKALVSNGVFWVKALFFKNLNKIPQYFHK
ncbi:glycosyl transferase [Pseudoalteromonas sp. MSK9-3]|nr:glycosyl transferase [Pseudoalteromonas sp. MSK9-3]